MAFKIRDLDGSLEETIGRLEIRLGYTLLEEVEKDYQVWCSNSSYYLPEFNISIHSADICIYYEMLDEYKLYESMYIVFDSKSKKFLYSETGGTLESCIYNYINQVLDIKMNMDDVENFDCTFEFGEEILKDKVSIFEKTSSKIKSKSGKDEDT